MGQTQQAQPPTPQQSAQAQAISQAAGTKFNIAASPVEAYAEAMNQLQFNPIFQRVQSAANANSGMQNALANMATNTATNPYGTAGQNAFNRTASERLAGIMGQGYYPGLTQTNTAGAFDYPSNSMLPDLGQIQLQAAQLGKAVPTLQFKGYGGMTPSLNYANG